MGRRRRRNTGAGNGAIEADGPRNSQEGDGGGSSDAEGSADGRRPGLQAGVAGAEDTEKVAPFVGGDGGGVSEAEESATGRRTGLEAGVDVVEAAEDTKKVSPFVGEDGGGADGSFAGRREAGGGVMAPALDKSTNKMEPFSGSYAVGGSSGGSYAGRCDDRVSPPLDTEVPNATHQRTSIHSGVEHPVSIRHVNESCTDRINKQHQSGCLLDYRAQGSQGISFAGGEESQLGKLSVIAKTILSWQLQDILDDDPERKKVKVVPSNLESIKTEEYINEVSDLVTEECRANLKASLQRIHSTPSGYSVTDVLNTGIDFVYFIDINLSLVLDVNHNLHMAREGDIYLFSTISHQDTNFRNYFTCFGMVVGTSTHSNFHQGFKVMMLEKPQNIKFGSFLLNVSDAINGWNTLQLYDKEVCSGINYIMKLNELDNHHCNLWNKQSGWADTASNNLNLSKAQLGIAKSLSLAVQCTHKHVVKMVTGPRGSGKTKIAVAMLHFVYQLNLRVVVCVPKKTSTFQLWKTIEESGYPKNDIIVLDSLKGTKLPSKFHQSCLHNKSYQFRTCMIMARQWVEEMQMLLQLKMYCPSSCNHELKHDRCSRTGLPIFTRKLYRKAFQPLALDLRKVLLELRDRFSNMCLPSNNTRDIDTVLGLLDGFQNLLLNEAPSEEHIQQAFGYLPALSRAEKLIQITSGSNGPTIAKKLNDARLKVDDFLRTFGKSIVVPKFGSRKEIENYCVAHCRVIIGTPESIFQLHAMNMSSTDLLIVDDASQFREYDLITPLCLPSKHILVFSDLYTSPPTVKSQVCGEYGFHNSLIQRLLKSKIFPHIKLYEQFAVEPSIFQFVNNQFYNGEIKSASIVSCAAHNKNFANLEFSNYCFIDVTAEHEIQDCIEIAGILYMIKILQDCWEDVDQSLHIAIVCIPNSPVFAMKDGLISKYAADNRIKLSIMYSDNIDGHMYDVVIISAFFKNRGQIDLKDMTAAITRARHCFWFIGDLSTCPGTLGELVDDARHRKCLIKLDPKKLQMLNDLSDFPSSNNDSLMVHGVESTWNGKPYRSKFILAPMRNQGNSDICTLQSSLGTTETEYKFEYARHEPPEDFDWILCTCDLNKKYKDVVDKEIGDEVIEHRGSKRLETLHNILENPGVLGCKSLHPEVTKLFRVKSCSKLEIKNDEDLDTALCSLATGSVLVGDYRISRNYFGDKPGQVYHYDKTMPYLNPRSSLPYSHAVMMIGSGTELKKSSKRERLI